MDLSLGHKHNVVGSKGERLVYKLHKSIYGLKQASRQWFDKFSHALLLLGFSQSKSDYSLFTHGSGNHFVSLLVYVDDIIIIAASLVDVADLKKHLNSVFKLKDLGCLKYFLGLELARSLKGFIVSQRNCVLQLLKDTGFLTSKPASLSMDPFSKLPASDGVLLDDPSPYRRLIGRLLYLTVSRPDIMFVVHKLSQYVAAPRQSYLNVVYHLLRYLEGTPGQGIFLKALNSLKLKAFSYAD